MGTWEAWTVLGRAAFEFRIPSPWMLPVGGPCFRGGAAFGGDRKRAMAMPLKRSGIVTGVFEGQGVVRDHLTPFPHLARSQGDLLTPQRGSPSASMDSERFPCLALQLEEQARALEDAW